MAARFPDRTDHSRNGDRICRACHDHVHDHGLWARILGSKPVPAVPAAPAAPTFNQEEEETVAVIMAAVTDFVGKDKIASINIRPR